MNEINIDIDEIIPIHGYASSATNFPPASAATAKPIWKVISNQVEVAVRDLFVATEEEKESHNDCPIPSIERNNRYAEAPIRGFLVKITSTAATAEINLLMTTILKPLYFFASVGPKKRKITVGMINTADIVPKAWRLEL